jgi:hypothetical protein
MAEAAAGASAKLSFSLPPMEGSLQTIAETFEDYRHDA